MRVASSPSTLLDAAALDPARASRFRTAVGADDASIVEVSAP